MIKLRKFLADTSGTTLIEYALIGASISILIVAGATGIGTKISVYYSKAAAALS